MKPNQDITAENVQKVIDFLETLEENDFCRDSFRNDKKQSCTYGLIRIHSKSPFKNNEIFAFGLNQFSYDKTKRFLLDVNDNAPQDKIKETVVEHLKKLLIYL